VRSLKLEGACSVVLCGDLNCREPREDVLSLLGGREVSMNSYEWVYGRNIGKRSCARGTTCSAFIRREQCPNATDDGDSPLCWDHRCGCGREKQNKASSCPECACAGPPPLRPPPDGPFFAPQLALPEGLGLQNACEVATGDAAFMRLRFNPKNGEARSFSNPTTGDTRFIECRDHIFCSRSLRVAALLPPPALESLQGLPSLWWPSDHLALVADLELQKISDGSAASATAPAPPPKRQKSAPVAGEPQPAGVASRTAGVPARGTPTPPRAVRSWGETSMRESLPQ